MIPEADIALACARASLTEDGRARLSARLAQSVDWPRLIALAERHGVLPLVSHHLTTSFGPTVPEWVRQELRARARAILGRNLMMTTELIRVVRRLESGAIPALPYKGPALALAAYGSLALRSFDDLDLLVPRRHVRDAIRLMLDDGYRPLYQLGPAQETAYLKTQCEYIVERDDVRVELHWEIVPPYFSVPFDLDRLRARAVPTALGGATLRTLCPEDLLLVLCAHASKHCWDRLEWIASFAEIVRRNSTLDWAGVGRAAQRAGATRLLDVGLGLARDLMGVELPEPARAHVDRDSEARALTRDVSLRVRSGDLATLDRPQEVRFHLRSRERLRDRLRYTVRLATTQTLGDWELVGLPRGIDASYRVIRPLRLIGKFGWAVARSLRALVGGSRGLSG